MTQLRHPAVAGAFYPQEREILAADVQAYLDGVPQPSRTAPPPKAIVVPHAGYVYSAPVAAFAYALLKGTAVDKIVLLGPSHRVPLLGLALPTASAFATPLGVVPLATEDFPRLLKLPGVAQNDIAHAWEHALEVQLPFLQTVLDSFRLVPLVVGQASPEQVAAVLEVFWPEEGTLFVISSDLSHYLPYDTARRTDRSTIDAMLALDDALGHDQACGASPVNGLLHLARKKGMRGELLDLRNSGDTAGDRSRVVGYASVAFYKD